MALDTPVTLDPKRSALVLIDLQNGIVAMPTQPHSGADTLEGTTAEAAPAEENEVVDLEAALGGGIRKAPAAVTADDEAEVAATH